MGTLVGLERSLSGLQPHAAPPALAFDAMADLLGEDPSALLAPFFDAPLGAAMTQAETDVLIGLLQRTLSVAPPPEQQEGAGR
jgi:hypothetical protein